jgi:hypothetical protein
MLLLWDACEALHPLDRTLAMLRAGWPEESFDALASLPIGERERRAAALRLTTFGHAAEGVHECPACGLSHEIDPPLCAILEAAPVAVEPLPLLTGGYELLLRALDSRDQAAITHATDAAAARAQLLRRCVVAASRSGEPVDLSVLPGEVVREIADTLAERDSHAETLITLTYTGCGQPWTIVFDAGEFLWREVVMHARRLMREIDRLARAYHWSEAEVLSLSARRRQAYLDLVGA